MEKNSKFEKTLGVFRKSYIEALSAHGFDPKVCVPLFDLYVKLIREQIESPFQFQPYHQMVREPFDYYQFGIDFFFPLVDIAASTVLGNENLKKAASYIENGQNVIFLANHQTEADPQAISILLEKKYPPLAVPMIFVAGERVLTDPVAIPFSMGRNLLCIYSKRYIDQPAHLKEEKLLHNKKTMELMSSLLKEGGKCIYVAPSGGRDRPNTQGKVEVARFDAKSIELFYLMAKRSGTLSHFFPMALSTHDILPPPQTVQVEIGEARATKRGDIHLAVGPEVDMENFPGSDNPDKKVRRQIRADYIWQCVCKDYYKLGVPS